MVEDQVDFSRLDAIAGDNAALRGELLRLFMETVHRCVVPPRNEAAWDSAMHELCGAANNLGFTRVGDVCHQARQAPYGEYATYLKHVEEAVAPLRAFIEAEQ